MDDREVIARAVYGGVEEMPEEVADLIHKSMGKDFTRVETLAAAKGQTDGR